MICPTLLQPSEEKWSFDVFRFFGTDLQYTKRFDVEVEKAKRVGHGQVILHQRNKTLLQLEMLGETIQRHSLEEHRTR
jgi:hypothetical protein